MKGKHLISITSRRAEYRLELERKISVIKGNSGTGKSSVIRLISDYLELGKDSGIKLTISSSASVLVLTNSSDWEKILPSVGNTILFLMKHGRMHLQSCFLMKMSDTYIQRLFRGNSGPRIAMRLSYREVVSLRVFHLLYQVSMSL